MMDSPPTKEHKSPELSPQRESPLPSVSSELLDFYRQKVVQFDGEHDDLLQKLEKYRSTAEEQVEALQAQLEEQTRLAKEQVEAFIRRRDRLQRMQNLLYESTRESCS